MKSATKIARTIVANKEKDMRRLYQRAKFPPFATLLSGKVLTTQGLETPVTRMAQAPSNGFPATT